MRNFSHNKYGLFKITTSKVSHIIIMVYLKLQYQNLSFILSILLNKTTPCKLKCGVHNFV